MAQKVVSKYHHEIWHGRMILSPIFVIPKEFYGIYSKQISYLITLTVISYTYC